MFRNHSAGQPRGQPPGGPQGEEIAVQRGARFGKDKFIEIAHVIKHAPEEYATISEDWRQENFVMAVSVIFGLHEHMAAFWKPEYKKYKYISSLHSSPYKSGQMVLARLEELCGREYVERLIEQSHRV